MQHFGQIAPLTLFGLDDIRGHDTELHGPALRFRRALSHALLQGFVYRLELFLGLLALGYIDVRFKEFRHFALRVELSHPPTLDEQLAPVFSEMDYLPGPVTTAFQIFDDLLHWFGELRPK